MKTPRGNPLLVLVPFVIVALGACRDSDLPTTLAAPARAHFTVTPGDYVVNSTDDADDGACDATHCSLREAVRIANAAAVAKTITFNIPGCDASPCTITLGAVLPWITSVAGITIDGSGQKIAVSGNNASEVEVVLGGTLTLKNLTIENGYFPYAEGGAMRNTGRLTVMNSTFSGNTSPSSGGAISNTGTLTVVNSVFTGNTAARGNGGAIDTYGPLTVDNSTFAGNAADYGGAINTVQTCCSAITVAITNSTFTGNSATWYGGAFYNGLTGTIAITSSTFAANAAGLSLGAGIFVANGTNIRMRNTIMAGPGSLCGGSGGTITDDGYNIDNGTSCGFNASGSLSNTDPLLGALAANGGPTPTQALLPGSPAVDAGACTNYLGATISTDQRGVSRPQGRTCDIGAFEVQSGWTFTGFYAPVDNAPIVNLVKAGSAVPVKFGLGGDRGLTIFAAGYPNAPAVPCTTGAPTDGITDVISAGGSSLSYDASTGIYTYVWKTDKAWANTCRTLTLRFIDGTTKTASFTFAK